MKTISGEIRKSDFNPKQITVLVETWEMVTKNKTLLSF